VDAGSTLYKLGPNVWIASADGYYHFRCCRASSSVEPFIAAGYSVFAIAGTDSAVNFGGGRDPATARRLSLRAVAGRGGRLPEGRSPSAQRAAKPLAEPETGRV
jgi:hypothetical protein